MQGSDNISTCRHCRFYHSEGRRGGNCQQLKALVQGSWKACQLAASPFAPAWEIQEVPAWQLETVEIPTPALPIYRSSSVAEPSNHQASVDSTDSTEVTASVIPITAIVQSKRKPFPLAPTA